MSESSDELNELREQTKWLRFLGLQALRPLLRDVLKDKRELQAYELTDGSRSTRDIGGRVGVDPKTISNRWQKWTALGIAISDAKGRATHLDQLLRGQPEGVPDRHRIGGHGL